ncbi:DUF3575 domain-containing protein [uncultured Bacteroides sp.]|jgi:hypothetical protein|uniref:DUF3575 domain-containing protein n=1 Tax=uncultured Bacteroides sp. TaxID=162156 RepID=UPI00258A2D80|nr:DUF3575 domain-containing protein [uncultured Bacteroides sp.]
MNTRFRHGLVLFLLAMCAAHARAQESEPDPDPEPERIDTVNVTLYFQQNVSTSDALFRGNGTHQQAFIRELDNLRHDKSCRVQSIHVTSGASPEGSTNLNKLLAESRALEICAFIKQYLPMSDHSTVEINPKGTDWQGLTELAEADPSMPCRTEVLDILHNTPEWISRGGAVVDGRKRRLGMLQGGKAWDYMLEHFFPDLRRADARIIFATRQPKRKPIQERLRDTIILRDTVMVRDTILIRQTDTIYSVVRQRTPFYMSAKTNLLYDAALVPNIGAEFYLGRGWAIGGTWMYAWWKSDRAHNYWRNYGGELDVRKYFGNRAAAKPLTGHHLGLYLQGLTYDFELGGTGYLSYLSYGVGIEYGYSLPIARRLNLDFGIGVGYLGGEYKVYDPIEGCYVWRETRQRHWFGPTKAEISLVWLIGWGNYNEKKGGAK